MLLDEFAESRRCTGESRSARDSMAITREANEAEKESVHCREAMAIQKPARLNLSRVRIRKPHVATNRII